MRIQILRQWSFSGSQKAFALPTVLIASTVMLAVLTVTLASVQSGVGVALENAHYSRYAKSAAQSGIVMAKACLNTNNYSPTWTTNPLKPNTNCAGVVQGGLSVYLHDDTADGVRSTFTVDPPTPLANGVQRLTVNATTERIRQSTGEVVRTYIESEYVSLYAQADFRNVAYGYRQYDGGFFGVIGPDGDVKTVGLNTDGQLGNGTTGDATTPQTFALPGTLRASQLFTNFLSMGFNMFAITTDGQLYGAGKNSSGQLGNGATATAQSTPVKFQLPAGVKPVFVAPGQDFVYVIGDNNNVYSAGACVSGALGYTYTISGCANQSTYRRVALPTVNLSDPNTLPVATSDYVQSSNLTTDRENGIIRMQGGRVYGWGINDRGQLGNGTLNPTSTPIQLTTLGNSGQPKATQIAFDGVDTYILDDTGTVWVAGSNLFGSLGAPAPIATSATGKCITNTGNSTTNGTQVTIFDCNNSASQAIEWAEDGTLRVRPNGSTVKCLENAGGVATDGNPIRINTCSSSSAAQQWVFADNTTILNPATGKCMENPGNTMTNGTGQVLKSCYAFGAYPAQNWQLRHLTTFTKMMLPAGHGTVKRISTDQVTVLILMTDGTVWGYGSNLGGQLGSGNLFKYNPKIQQFILPAGRTAVDLSTVKTGTDDQWFYANTYVVLDDGSVYGAGSNLFGQLGDGTAPFAPVTTAVKMILPPGARARTVQSGFGTAVVLAQDGKIYTVGNNYNGQLGDGTTTNSYTPRARQYVNTRPVVLY